MSELINKGDPRAALKDGIDIHFLEDRAAVIDLSDTYLVTGERLLVQSTNDEIKDLGDLDTKTVCVQSGSGVDAHIEDAKAA